MASDIGAPFTGAASVTPNDSTPLTNAAVALYIGVTGDVAVTTLEGNNVTFTNVAVGWLPVRCTHVLSTGTTATGIIAGYYPPRGSA